jgi:site-specific recombinase XerD
VMGAAGAGLGAERVRALIVLLWRAGLRISEALAPTETDLDSTRGLILVRQGKGGKSPEIDMDRWAWSSFGRGGRSAGALPQTAG